eukprot:TRINITY_DN10197_c0_g1_i1.p1 TRINITY_DN10197_c0_g1~~TRINITY_DN10197_c0_g1_i1.p1  ORF type:complete len:269 (-),score=74.86 TRINITY_DN10197_c0_g1_i1:52-858(-)
MSAARHMDAIFGQKSRYAGDANVVVSWARVLLQLLSFSVPLPSIWHKDEQRQEVIIVLGQSLNPDGSVPRTMQRRAEAAAEAYKEAVLRRPDAIIICSGGDPVKVGISEASHIGKVIEKLGVPREAIILEEKSLNTLQNAWFALPLVKNEFADVILVTSEFHMPRSAYVFEAVLMHMGRHEKLQIRQCAAWGGCPTAEEVSAMSPASSINRQTLVERLTNEVRYIRNEVVQINLKKHVPGVDIAPLPAARLEQAVDDARDMLSLLASA